ncbi:hypothetical protein GUJ93_ZPchr0012g20510 [Zizania palustris]|uniref:Uncharacterized protein n=1 Tax=Zizania palustris TaxID=103762 RepID=A0A8J5WKY1_ZIZPA|nr:hypothetical protein GUJ93_ZPchr0012g20510 [Zizania palustris]
MGSPMLSLVGARGGTLAVDSPKVSSVIEERPESKEGCRHGGGRGVRIGGRSPFSRGFRGGFLVVGRFFSGGVAKSLKR